MPHAASQEILRRRVHHHTPCFGILPRFDAKYTGIGFQRVQFPLILALLSQALSTLKIQKAFRFHSSVPLRHSADFCINLVQLGRFPLYTGWYSFIAGAQYDNAP